MLSIPSVMSIPPVGQNLRQSSRISNNNRKDFFFFFLFFLYSFNSFFAHPKPPSVLIPQSTVLTSGSSQASL